MTEVLKRRFCPDDQRATNEAITLALRMDHMSIAFAQGRLAECRYECDLFGAKHWQLVSQKLEHLAFCAPELFAALSSRRESDQAISRTA